MKILFILTLRGGLHGGRGIKVSSPARQSDHLRESRDCEAGISSSSEGRPLVFSLRLALNLSILLRSII